MDILATHNCLTHEKGDQMNKERKRWLVTQGSFASKVHQEIKNIITGKRFDEDIIKKAKEEIDRVILTRKLVDDQKISQMDPEKLEKVDFTVSNLYRDVLLCMPESCCRNATDFLLFIQTSLAKIEAKEKIGEKENYFLGQFYLEIVNRCLNEISNINKKEEFQSHFL